MSEIDYSLLRSLTSHEVCRALERDGFTFTRQRGSHHRYAHPDGRRVTVPLTRSGDTFAPGTLRSILERQARWTADDLRRLDLIP
jgi:predicted RNA binding protein YcfA (HicA-like mRNA interferase family)